MIPFRRKENAGPGKIGTIGIVVMICLVVFSGACGVDNIDTRPMRAGILQNDAIDEASGLAASRIHPDTLWMINDSGSAPVLFAVTTRGADAGQVTVTDADNRDWEDLAAFIYRGTSYLAIADVGDNAARRDFCTIYLVKEPAAVGRQMPYGGKVKPAWRIDFRYEDGPRDCEAIAVDTVSEEILLLSKRTLPPVLYSLALIPRPIRAFGIARRLAEISTIKRAAPNIIDFGGLPESYFFRLLPTGMDISPDRRHLAILTYRYIFLFQRPVGFHWDTALSRSPKTFSLPSLEQAEAICFSPGGRHLFVSSERRPAPLLRISLAWF